MTRADIARCLSVPVLYSLLTNLIRNIKSKFQKSIVFQESGPPRRRILILQRPKRKYTQGQFTARITRQLRTGPTRRVSRQKGAAFSRLKHSRRLFFSNFDASLMLVVRFFSNFCKTQVRCIFSLSVVLCKTEIPISGSIEYAWAKFSNNGPRRSFAFLRMGFDSIRTRKEPFRIFLGMREKYLCGIPFVRVGSVWRRCDALVSSLCMQYGSSGWWESSLSHWIMGPVLNGTCKYNGVFKTISDWLWFYVSASIAILWHAFVNLVSSCTVIVQALFFSCYPPSITVYFDIFLSQFSVTVFSNLIFFFEPPLCRFPSHNNTYTFQNVHPNDLHFLNLIYGVNTCILREWPSCVFWACECYIPIFEMKNLFKISRLPLSQVEPCIFCYRCSRLWFFEVLGPWVRLAVAIWLCM